MFVLINIFKKQLNSKSAGSICQPVCFTERKKSFLHLEQSLYFHLVILAKLDHIFEENRNMKNKISTVVFICSSHQGRVGTQLFTTDD